MPRRRPIRQPKRNKGGKSLPQRAQDDGGDDEAEETNNTDIADV